VRAAVAALPEPQDEAVASAVAEDPMDWAAGAALQLPRGAAQPAGGCVLHMQCTFSPGQPARRRRAWRDDPDSAAASLGAESPAVLFRNLGGERLSGQQPGEQVRFQRHRAEDQRDSDIVGGA
jgi:hypothetical protein